MVWSCLVFGLALSWQGWPRRPEWRVVLLYAASGAVIGVNWLLYIWAVTHRQVLASSLGYFLNPLVSVLLGAWLFRERLQPRQKLAVLLAAGGAAWLGARAELAQLGLALALALSFALYGVLRKKAPLPSLPGMGLETLTLLPLGLGYLAWLESQHRLVFGHAGWPISLLLAGAGLVTALPLFFFSRAAQGLPLSTLGMLQYISPTLQFALAVFGYHEPFSPVQLVGFSLIWAGLALFSDAPGLVRRRRDGRSLRE